MSAIEYTLFDTAVGPMGIAWTDLGVSAVQLPETNSAAIARRLEEKVGATRRSEPPPVVRDAIDRMSRLLAGEVVDLTPIPLDLSAVTPFRRRVLEASRRIPAGETVSYGDLARTVGSPGGARAVGQAMATNPLPLVVPCHRVVAADGSMHGFSAYGGLVTKKKLLQIERSAAPSDGPLFGGPPRLPYDAQQAVQHLSSADERLAKVIQRVGPFKLQPVAAFSPYESLARSIIFQQLNGKAAETIAGRVHAAFGGERYPDPERLLAAPDELFRNAGVSRNKLAALRDLAARTLDGTVPECSVLARMSNEDIIDRLTVVRGVGRWTVEMMLMFRLGRPDVLPVDDYGVRKAYGLIYMRGRLPKPKLLEKRVEHWRPFRSVASWYLWRSLDQ